MTVVESPKGRASHNLGNRCAIPTFPPPGYCYIFFQNLSRKESSSPPAPSLFRLILRLEKTGYESTCTKMGKVGWGPRFRQSRSCFRGGYAHHMEMLQLFA